MNGIIATLAEGITLRQGDTEDEFTITFGDDSYFDDIAPAIALATGMDLSDAECLVKEHTVVTHEGVQFPCELTFSQIPISEFLVARTIFTGPGLTN